MKEGGLGEAALLATTAQGLTDPTPMTGAELLGDEGLVAVAAVVVKVTMVVEVIGMWVRMTRALRKATWEGTTTTRPGRLQGLTTTRTATTTLQVPDSTTQIPMVATAPNTAMKVRLRVQFEF